MLFGHFSTTTKLNERFICLQQHFPLGGEISLSFNVISTPIYIVRFYLYIIFLEEFQYVHSTCTGTYKATFYEQEKRNKQKQYMAKEI